MQNGNFLRDFFLSPKFEKEMFLAKFVEETQKNLINISKLLKYLQTIITLYNAYKTHANAYERLRKLNKA